ncbi:helix-turn-helix domain-containing protein [Jatrophihabitans sp. DSM 45814]
MVKGRAARRAGTRRWLDVGQASDYCNLAPRTIRQRIADGILPAYQPVGTRAVRIDISDLDEMMTGGGRMPSTATEAAPS